MQSDEEQKEGKKEEKTEAGKGFADRLKSVFIKPDGSPDPSGLFIAALVLATLYYKLFKPTPTQEINYQDFVNVHLSKGNVKMITLSENHEGQMFKYKATIETVNGPSFYLVLP